MHKDVAQDDNAQKTRVFPNRRAIYIDEHRWDKVKLVAIQNGWSISKLIRHVIDEKIGDVLGEHPWEKEH